MKDISRREFLKASAVTAGILLLPNTTFSQPQEKPESERLSDLTKIVVLSDEDRKLKFDKLDDGNSYFLGQVEMNAAIETARAYFPKEPDLEKNISGIFPYNVARDIRFSVGETSVAINYIRKFRDQKNCPKNPQPRPEGRGLNGDFSTTGQFLGYSEETQLPKAFLYKDRSNLNAFARPKGRGFQPSEYDMVQMAGFGGEWGTQPGTCWEFYAHLVNPVLNSNVRNCKPHTSVFGSNARTLQFRSITKMRPVAENPQTNLALQGEVGDFRAHFSDFKIEFSLEEQLRLLHFK